MSMIWLWVGLAAQAQGLPGGLPGGLTLGAPKGEAQWVTADTATTRFWGDASVAGPELKAGDPVQLIVIEGDRARVVKGDRYGWLPAALLTTEAPAAAAPTGLPGGLGGAPLLPPLQLPGAAPK